MGVEALERRAEDRNIATLTMAVERLAENQSLMATEIRELTKTISKLDVVMEKMINIEDNYKSANKDLAKRCDVLEHSQLYGCPALKEMRIGYEGKYDKVITAIDYNRKEIENISKIISRINWMIVSAVVIAVLGIVVK